jgi:hypothetical protein
MLNLFYRYFIFMSIDLLGVVGQVVSSSWVMVGQGYSFS